MRLLVGALCLAVTPLAHSADWPQFRGPDGSGKSDAKNLPTQWSATKNILWETPLPGRGSSSPVIVGDVIFLTAFTGYGMDPDDPGDKADLRLHVLCYDLSDGALVWDQSIPASPAEQAMGRRVADHGYTTPTPVSDGEAVYAYFGVSGVVAYDMNGKPMWTAPTGNRTAGFGSAASPIVYENLVIVNASIEARSAFAFDKKTGRQAWVIDDVQRTWTTPTIVDVPGNKPELIINEKDTICGYDPQTGVNLWTCGGIEDYIVPVVVGHKGIAYCLGGRSNRAVAVRCGGRGDVTETHRLWLKRIGANVTSPVYLDGKLYWASDRAIYNCLDADTGEEIARERLPTRSRVYASMVYGDGKLYVTTRDKGVVVLKAEPEYTELARNVIETDDNLFNAGPALTDGKILLRSDSFLYCIGESAAVASD